MRNPCWGKNHTDADGLRLAHARSSHCQGVAPPQWEDRPVSHADRLLALARECRERAEEILARAETFSGADAREGMRRIAASYEKLAERLEKEAGLPLGYVVPAACIGLGRGISA
jgi:hypothetical protein